MARAAFALILGAGLAVLWLQLFPGRLPDRTDIVGYPILTNFNVTRYFHAYAAITLVFPLAALTLFGALGFVGRWGRRRRPQGREVSQRRLADEPPSLTSPGRAARVARSGLVGLVLGLEAAYAIGGGLEWFWPSALIAAAVYVGIVLVVAATAAGEGEAPFWRRHAVVNALAAPLTVAGLYGASRASHITVLADGSVDRYPWMPLTFAVAAAAGTLAWVTVRVVRAGHDGGRILRIERDSVMFLTGPALLFLLVAYLPGALGRMDLFHEGESLAGSFLTESGRFPWRDLFLIHGPLQDVLSVFPGMKVFQDSRWGAAAGFDVLIRPAVALGFYVLHVRLFRGDWVILPATAAIVALGLDSRFLLLPFALVLLIALLRKPGNLVAVALAAVLFVQSVLTPETAPMALAVAVVLASFEVYYRDPDQRLSTSILRTTRFGLGALVLALAWAGYLASRGALDDFLGHYLTFASGHELTGGIPIQWGSRLFFFAVVAPIASVLLFGFFFFVQLRRDRLRLEDWAAAALALYVTYFYRKFLSRADNHVFQVLAMSVPLIGYVIYRATAEIERALRRGHGPRALRPFVAVWPLAFGLLLTVVVWTPNRALALVEGLPGHFRATAPAPAWLPSLGYATGETLDRAGFEDLREVLNALPDSSGQIFDFTNQPAMFHYLLGYQPSTRYYHVSMAIRRATQDDLLDELRINPPAIVVFHAAAGLPGWDGVSNAVRHYEISEYLLDHYRPAIIAGGNLLMLRKDLDLPPGWPSVLDLNVPPVPQNLYFYTLPCDWGYSPNFLDVDPPPAEVGALNLRIPPAGGQQRIVEFEVPPDFQTYDWLEIRTSGGLRADRFVLSDGSDFVNGGIHFRTLNGAGPRYLVRVGSCLQWHGYSGGRLVLLHDRPQDIVAVRLLRSRAEDGIA